MTHEKLFKLACAARENAYAPYSKYKVGACILTESGKTFTGCNFENASYGATICAERCAVSNAIANGVRKFTKVAISSDEGYAWPCGICRQVLNEFKSGDMVVMVGGKNTPWKTKMLSELLPESFGPNDLNV